MLYLLSNTSNKTRTKNINSRKVEKNNINFYLFAKQLLALPNMVLANIVIHHDTDDLLIATFLLIVIFYVLYYYSSLIIYLASKSILREIYKLD